MESSFLDVCLTNGNNIVSMFNVLLLLLSTIILSISTNIIVSIIIALLYIAIIAQYTIPLLSSPNKVSYNNKIGLYVITGASIVLNTMLYSFNPIAKQYLMNVMLYSIPSILTLALTTELNLKLDLSVKEKGKGK